MIQTIDYDLHVLKLIYIKFHVNWNFLPSIIWSKNGWSVAILKAGFFLFAWFVGLKFLIHMKFDSYEF